MPTRVFPAASLLPALIAGSTIFSLSGCASDRLVATAPSGVNLTGNWKLDLNLSDDPDRLMDQDKSLSKPDSGRRRRGRGSPTDSGPGPGPGMPPIGSPPDGPGFSGPDTHFASAASGPLSARALEGGGLSSPTSNESALSENWTGMSSAPTAPGIEQSNPLPPSTTPPAQPTGRGRSAVSQLLAAPSLMSIQQAGSKVTIRSRMADGSGTADDFVAGTKGTVKYGKDETAEREAGWRGPIFVTTLKTKNGWREDDYALDEDGRLIVTSDVKARHIRELEIKHVYDRIAP